MKFRLVFLTFIISGYLVFKSDLISIDPEFLFITLSLILTIYLFIEIIQVHKYYIKSNLLNPVVLASLFTLILGFGIVNIIFLINDYYSTLLYDKFGNEPYQLLNTALFVIIIGAVSLWMGYDMKAGEKFYNSFINLPIVKRFLKKEFEIRKGILFLLYILSVFFRLLAIKLGIFGYSEDELSATEYVNVSQFLYIFGSIGNLVLLVSSLSYFSRRDKSLIIPNAIVFLGEMFFGFVSGSKAAVIMPILIIMFSNFIINKKIMKSYVVITFVLVMVAYIVIEPFRYVRYADQKFRSDVPYIVSTMVYARNVNAKHLENIYDPGEIFLAFLMRNNYIVETAKAIDFADNVGLKKYDPDFQFNLITIPLQAYIPRFVWESKPIASIGSWFTKSVWGWNIKTSIAMTPFGFLYFAGGVYLIVIFFFIFGIMCKFLYQFLRLNSGGILIYMGLIATLIYIDSMVNSIFITWLRNLPILLFLQYIIFKR